MVCSSTYPNVLAFCFLDELQKEFIVTYDPKRVRSAVRPYSFIEFDTFIQKTKQRYNSPRSLSTRINLSDMQTEIRLRPPLLCGGLNLLRGVHAIESILQNDDEDFNYVIAFFLGTAACLYQCFLFCSCSSWRSLKSFLSFSLVCLSNMYLYELRNVWQILFHVAVAAFMTLQIRLRQPLGKAPDYNV
ncbi:Vesicle-trafficking protein SEC22a [Liparis tanakae]|uniref:Vesicle-trafficking protein SEC22a n=1 Tax=Liparis tanakae TaxID=230148 RepID=A0A4Z2F202_9TELE|nr:Vesicle-trafficking protein SEC22a [Liparis tanakae]